MRLIYLADIHDAFGPLEALLELTAADLYVLGGDLLYRVFPRYRTAWRFLELQEIMRGRARGEGPKESLWEAAQRLSHDSGDAIGAAQAREYLSLSRRAERAMSQAYQRLRGRLDRFPQGLVRLLPGNYDMDLRRTALGDLDLHLRCVEVGGCRVAGYGGAPVFTPGIPDHLQVPYREGPGSWGARSEAGQFFREKRPHVVALHHPVYGHLDRLAGLGHVGSARLRDYVDECRPHVVLSGHLHEAWGGERSGGTFFFNPSNFGSAIQVTRVRPGGYFLYLEVDAGGLGRATVRRLEGRLLYDIVAYEPRERGLDAIVLDERRFSAMMGDVPRPRHIRPIRRLQRIRSFFLGYETAESKALVRELRGVYRRIRAEGMHVAFDLLGSLNFGMARRGSDVDLVVYLRGVECVPDELDACSVPRPLGAVFQELRQRHLEIEVCDSLDLDRVARAIEEENGQDGHLQRFIFYRAVCRPVNLRLIKEVEGPLMRKGGFRAALEDRLREHLRVLVSSVRHVRSFDKYLARLREDGISVPREVEEGIRQYLRGA